MPQIFTVQISIFTWWNDNWHDCVVRVKEQKCQIFPVFVKYFLLVKDPGTKLSNIWRLCASVKYLRLIRWNELRSKSGLQSSAADISLQKSWRLQLLLLAMIVDPPHFFPSIFLFSWKLDQFLTSPHKVEICRQLEGHNHNHSGDDHNPHQILPRSSTSSLFLLRDGN